MRHLRWMTTAALLATGLLVALTPTAHTANDRELAEQKDKQRQIQADTDRLVRRIETMIRVYEYNRLDTSSDKQLLDQVNGILSGLSKEQMTALSCCRMTLAYLAPNGRVSQMQATPIDSFDAWLHPDPAQGAFWPDMIELHPKFFNTLLEHAVPLDPRAIGALQHSALALDVYTWMAHRLCRVRTDNGVKLYWKNLRDQFGQEYKNPKDFKKAFSGALTKVCAVYPTARISEEVGGIRLYPSSPPIPKTQIVVHKLADAKR